MKITRIIPITIFALMLCACTGPKPHPDSVVFKGKLGNVKDSVILVFKGNYKKYIPINSDGSFEDTLKINKGIYQFLLQKDKKVLLIYLDNNQTLELNADMEDFGSTAVFSGDLFAYNTYILQKDEFLKSPKGLVKEYYRYDQANFDKHIAKVLTSLDSLRLIYLAKDKINNEREISNNKRRIERFVTNFQVENEQYTELQKGTISPVFTNYESVDGTTKSLKDFKGSFVYIDVWASWCGPCKAQFPYLSILKEVYAEQNIKFLGLSVDVPKDREKWLASLKEFNLTGTQLIAPKAFESEFVQAYGIKSIPRFILIDPQGKIVDYDAPRPYEKDKLVALFNKVGI